jgi:type IV secretory pathway ATPase VirB11/archaellum biosynthesis ATPase
MNSNVKIIHCPTIRCNECPFSLPQTCKQLASIKNSKTSMKVILLEPRRKSIHVGGIGAECPTSPPWLVNGWETIFIDENNMLEYIKDLIDVCLVEPYLSLFWQRTPGNQITCKSLPLVKTSLELDLLSKLCEQSDRFTNLKSISRIQLNERIHRIKSNVFEEVSRSIPEINEKTRIRIAEVISHRTNALGPLFPIILNDKIEEIYLDKPESNVYFDHQNMGRCLSDITLSIEDIPSIITLLRAESNLHLDQMNPSLKTNLNVIGNILRIAVSIPPLSSDGFHFEIRRAKSEPFTLIDLINNGTLPLEAAAILLLAVISRFNITITGAPSVGKTTLLNALDMTTPRWWRKIYIEDALESRLLREHHQVRIKVHPVDELKGKLEKSAEIIKSLHRSPDYLILGEIQTKEHSQALFQAITAGIRTIQTCHSESAASLISRWTLNHGIEPSNIALIDIIVTLDRLIPGQSKRVVREIVEVKKKLVDGLLVFSGLNSIYNRNNDSEKVGGWAEDGVFLIRAHEIGLQNHIPAFNALIEYLRNAVKKEPSHIPLGEKLCHNIHPMEYSILLS